MLVIGDEIIETPMVWPCRYFETHSYRPILATNSGGLDLARIRRL